MTSAVPFSRPVRPPERPGDAERAPRELMTLPGASRDVRRWRLVEIRLGGEWRPGMLTVWRRPPGAACWVVHVRWAPDTDSPQPWGWFLYTEETVRPLPEPQDAPPPAAPFLGRWRDAVAVPAELAGDARRGRRRPVLAPGLGAGRRPLALLPGHRASPPGPGAALDRERTVGRGQGHRLADRRPHHPAARPAGPITCGGSASRVGPGGQPLRAGRAQGGASKPGTARRGFLGSGTAPEDPLPAPS